MYLIKNHLPKMTSRLHKVTVIRNGQVYATMLQVYAPKLGYDVWNVVTGGFNTITAVGRDNDGGYIVTIE